MSVEEGRRRRDYGIRRAVTGRERQTLLMRLNVLRAVMVKGWTWADDAVPDPTVHRQTNVGSVFKELSREKILRKQNKTRKSERALSHARDLPLWEAADPDAVAREVAALSALSALLEVAPPPTRAAPTGAPRSLFGATSDSQDREPT